MVAAKTFSRRSVIAILVIMAILLLLFGAAHYFLLKTLSANVELLAQSGELLPEQQALVKQFNEIREVAGTYFLPIAGLVLIMTGLFLWWIMCRLFQALSGRNERKTVAAAADIQAPAEKQPPRDRTDEQLFLHLLSVLQREGRLVDFFSENLADYEDNQIGAAVRTIHESCKKAVEKYLALEPVVRDAEGASYLVPPGFDPTAIKLTGNVAGKPPFEGVVRHRGWRAGRLELPTLSGNRDNRTIAPAEIEIL